MFAIHLVYYIDRLKENQGYWKNSIFKSTYLRPYLQKNQKVSVDINNDYDMKDIMKLITS